MPGKRYFRYIAWRYLKSFLILLFGLSLAVVFIDYLQNAHRLSGGVNHRILYVFFTWEYMLTLLYPLTILLALAWTQVNFIRQNIFVALYAFGYSRRQIFRPFFLMALLIYLLFLALENTEFAYGRSRAGAILHKSGVEQKMQNLFFKYNGNFVYVRELDPVAKVLKGVILFQLKDRRVDATIRIPRAEYREDHWVAPLGEMRKKRYDSQGEVSGFEERRLKDYSLLEGYRPKVVKLIYEGKALTLIDGLRAWYLLHRQGLDSSRVRATLYNLLLMPLFALGLMPILFFTTRPYQRFVRMERIWIVNLGASLLGWAFFFAMYRLGISGAVDPNLGQLLPLGLLLLFSLFFYFRQTRRE